MSAQNRHAADEADEASRLAALALYDVLDTPAEAGFDDIVRIAAQICGTPMALISLIDDRRQWFKAAIGLDVPETPREVAFCAHAIQQPNVFEVADAAADARFVDNPLVTGTPGLRFYAGAPLLTPDGQALGTLCVLDDKPRSLTAAQTGALEALARQVMAQLDLRRAVARHRADEAHRDLLVEELRHRGRNTLAVVQAVVVQTLRDAAGPAEARDAIESRLGAMARAQDVLTRSDGVAARLDEVVASATDALVEGRQRIAAAGPEVTVNARAALSLTMALHELTTNAIKHGALSVEPGRIDIAWSADDDAFELCWSERGGPPTVKPTRQGFGSKLIARAVPLELGGTATIEYRPEGFRWTLRASLARLG